MKKTISVWLALTFLATPAWSALDFPSFTSRGQDKTLIRMNESVNPGLFQHEISVGTPLYQDGVSIVTLNARAGLMNLERPVTLPSGITLKSQLWDLRLGSSFTHDLPEKKSIGLSATFGSASDSPLSSSQVETLNTNLFYSFPDSEFSRWILLVNYSNNRSFMNNIPLPGFAYAYTPGPEFTGIFGVPFIMMRVQPKTTKLSFSIMSLLPWNSRLEIGYRIVGPIQAFILFEWGQQLYLRKDRTQSNQRLYYDEKKILLGLRSPLSQLLFAELSGGYGFDRAFFEADSYKNRNQNRSALTPGWNTSLSLSARF